jgi:hypothetical protein
MSNRISLFTATAVGPWSVVSARDITGETLDPPALNVSASSLDKPSTAICTLSGITSDERYVTRAEKTDPVQRQEGLGRPDGTRGALIPIRNRGSISLLSV